MEKCIAIGIAVFIVFALISILVLCQAIGEADKHAEQMMSEDKEDKEQR